MAVSSPKYKFGYQTEFPGSFSELTSLSVRELIALADTENVPGNEVRVIQIIEEIQSRHD